MLADIDFFPFPAIATEGRDAVEAPIDGLMLSKKGGENQAAKDLLAYMGTGAGQDAYASIDTSNLQTAKDADTSKFNALNKKSADAIANAKSISQFFDRDALPAMANNVMIPALQGFLKDGTIDTANLEAQAKALYAAQYRRHDHHDRFTLGVTSKGQGERALRPAERRARCADCHGATS